MVVPLALKGIDYHGESIAAILRNNLLRFGLGGIIMPFILMKGLDTLFYYLSWF
jgi:K+-transporting ATPase ATPase B chain